MAGAFRELERRIPMSVEEYERQPEGPPYCDYIDGESIEVNQPRGKHQVIGMRPANTCLEHDRSADLGAAYPETDVELPSGNWIVDQDSLGIEEYYWTQEGHLRISVCPAGKSLQPPLFPGLSVDLKTLTGF